MKYLKIRFSTCFHRFEPLALRIDGHYSIDDIFAEKQPAHQVQDESVDTVYKQFTKSRVDSSSFDVVPLSAGHH